MARSSTGVSGAARPPARSSSASSRPSMGFTPVIWKLLLNTPRMVARLMTSSVVRSTSTPCAFFSRERSMNTTAMRWPMFSSVFFSIFAAPRASRLTDTAGPSWVFGWNEASVS